VATSSTSLTQLGFYERLRQHPRGLWYVFWGELAERASYYGMRTLLALFLVVRFHYTDAQSGQTANGFTAACYILPLLGGLIADRWLGKYRTIVYWSFPYILGHIILGESHDQWQLYLALGLLAAGSGAIKPNTSTLMGQIYEKEGKKELLPEAFSFFYAAINIGAAITSNALPIVVAWVAGVDIAKVATADPAAVNHAYRIALMCPTVLMAVALGIFMLGKKYYPEEEIDRTPKSPEQRQKEIATLVRLSGVFGLIAMFWFVYDQSSSTWVLFGTRCMDPILYPSHVPYTAEQMQGLNPILIVLFTPLFNMMWAVIKRLRGGRDLPATQKMMIGFLLVVGCMGVMAFAGYQTHGGTVKVSIWYDVVATTIITMAELCVSVIGLEFAFNHASPETRSTVTAAFLFTVFLGDSFGTWFIGRFYPSEGPNGLPLPGRLNYGSYFLSQAIIMAVVAVLFYFVARKFEREDEAHQLEKAERELAAIRD
jgi:POT family proton-dependent oligopeptide transporter